MTKLTRKFIFAITLFVAVFAFSPVLLASTILFSPPDIAVKEGEHFTLGIMVDPHETKNYTAMIQVRYPPDLIEAESFTFFGDWLAISQPGYDGIDNTDGVLIKTAGYPRGFFEPTPFGTISFLSKKVGSGIVRVDDYSIVLDRSSQNVLTIPLGQASISVETPGTSLLEEVSDLLEEEVVIEEEEEEVTQAPLFDVIIGPAAEKAERNLIPIIIFIALAVLIITGYIIYRRKKKSYMEDKEGK